MRRLALLAVVVLLAAAMKLYATGTTEAPANFVLQDPPRPLPQIAIADGDGKAGSLPDFRGQFVLLNIWATWCVPCREEMPALNALEKSVGNDKFEVVAVNIDTGDEEKPQAFRTEYAIDKLGYYRDNTMGVFNVLKKQGLAFGPLEGDVPQRDRRRR